MKLKYIFYLLLFSIFLVPNSYAYVNNNTTYSIDYVDASNMDSQIFNDLTYNQFLEYFTNYDSEYYNLVVSFTSSQVTIDFYPKSFNNIKLSFFGFKNRHQLNYHSVFSSTTTQYKVNIQSSNTDYFGSNEFNKLKDCLDNNICWSSYENVNTSNFYKFSRNANSFENIVFISSNDIPSSINNNSSYVITTQSTYNYIYSSQVPIIVDYDSYYDYSDHYYKKLILNTELLEDESQFITYRDVFTPDNDDSTTTIYENVGNLYIGSIPKNNLNNFNATFTYNYYDENYVNSIDYKYLYFGRVNHTTYYSYEPINCSTSVLSSTAIDTSNKQATTTFFPYGLTCSSDLTLYDNIYIRIYNTYDVNTNSTISNLNVRVQSGYYKRLSDVRATSNSSYIYERFEDLDSSFSFMLSTQRALDYAYFETDNKYIASVNVNRTTNKIGSLILNPISFGTQSNTNALIYNMSNYYSDNTDIDLFLNYNTILSFNSSDDSINGTYTYYSDSNTITNGNVQNNHLLVVSDSYDVSYYFNQVNDFISSMSLDVMNFSILTQSFYDNAPTFLQYFIFSVFILLCLYFLYLLIRK